MLDPSFIPRPVMLQLLTITMMMTEIKLEINHQLYGSCQFCNTLLVSIVQIGGMYYACSLFCYQLQDYVSLSLHKTSHIN